MAGSGILKIEVVVNSLFFLISIFSITYSYQALAYKCAISIEYPPYQYIEKGELKGLDVDLINLYNKHTDDQITIIPLKWQEAVSTLFHTKDLDCIWGMEITKSRKERFKLTQPIYQRLSTLIAKKSFPYENLESLSFKIIARDEDSSIDKYIFSNSKTNNIRLRRVDTKEESIQLLNKDKVVAAILPEAVANFLSKKYKIDIKTLLKDKNPTNVGIAAKEAKVAKEIEANFSKLPNDEVLKIINKYKK